MPDGYMNPSYGRLMEGGKQADKQDAGGPAHKEAGKRAAHDKLPPHIHIHSHSGGHTVHIMHHDGRHEMHEHAHGDAEGMAEHVHTYLGTGQAPESVPEDEAAAMGER